MKRLQDLLFDRQFQQLLREIELAELDRKFCKHGMEHLWDVARITYILLLEEKQVTKLAHECNCDPAHVRELTYAAALLHDIGRGQASRTGEDHAMVSSALARPLLLKTGFSEKETRVICCAIQDHRRLPANPSLLSRALFRGDKLSRRCWTCPARAECYKYQGQGVETVY